MASQTGGKRCEITAFKPGCLIFLEGDLRSARAWRCRRQKRDRTQPLSRAGIYLVRSPFEPPCRSLAYQHDVVRGVSTNYHGSTTRRMTSYARIATVPEQSVAQSEPGQFSPRRFEWPKVELVDSDIGDRWALSVACILLPNSAIQRPTGYSAERATGDRSIAFPEPVAR